MNKVYQKVQQCYENLKNKISFKPEVAIVLGSGLGDFAERIQIQEILEYSEIEGFPTSTVQGHKGRFVFGYIEKVPVVVMQGRVHYYEGYTMNEVVLPIRLMKMLGAKVLFLTNASGGVNLDFQAGDLMMITDQIGSFVPSPLLGPNIDGFGTRFSDMSEIYDKKLQEIIRNTAKKENIKLQEGVYIQLTGPNYESPAEIRMCRALGADAVGMSTACEAIAANHMGMKICGISCISNMASGMLDQPLNHQEVQETADSVAPLFQKLVHNSVIQIGEYLE